MKEMKTAYLSSAYLAPVEYYTKLLAYDKIFIEQHDHYMKQTYRNRQENAPPIIGTNPTVTDAQLPDRTVNWLSLSPP